MATRTVRQSGGDFSSLANALSDASTANGDVISIEGTWTVDDTANATITDDLTIQTDADSKHPGYWDESQNHYRLVESGGDHALTLNGAYTATIDGLAIEQAATSGSSQECFRCVPGASDTVTIIDCLLYCSGDVTDQDCVYTGFNTSIGTITLENCVLYNAYRAGIHSQNSFSQNGSSGTVNVNSCTVWGNGSNPSPGSAGSVGGGIRFFTNGNYNASGFSFNVHNSIVVENDTGGSSGGFSPADFVFHDSGGSSTSPVWGISYSIDSDNSIATEDGGGTGNLASRTATDSTSPGAGDWVIFEDITTAPFDLRIVDNAENDAQDAHTTATAEGLTIPSADIVGTSRPQNTDYDMGAFEISAGAPPASVFRGLTLLGVGS